MQNLLTVTFIIVLRLSDLYTVKYKNAYVQNISESFSYAFFYVWRTVKRQKSKRFAKNPI